MTLTGTLVTLPSLLDFDQGLVSPLRSVGNGPELRGRYVAEVTVQAPWPPVLRLQSVPRRRSQMADGKPADRLINRSCHRISKPCSAEVCNVHLRLFQRPAE